MKYVDNENIERAKEAYLVICKHLEEKKKILDSEKLNPTVKEISDLYFGRLRISELFKRMKQTEIEAANPIDKDIILQQISQRSEFIKNKLPDGKRHACIMAISFELWQCKSGKFNVQNIDTIIQEYYTKKLTSEQIKVAKMLNELTASIDKAVAYFKNKDIYFPNLYKKREIPLLNGLGEIDILEVIRKIK